MVGQLARDIVSWLIEKKVIEKDDRELYEYAAFNRIFGILPFFIIIPFAICTDRFVNMIFIITVFVCLRTYGGGYHAGTPMQCVLCSCFTMMTATYVSALIENNAVIIMIVLFSGIMIVVLSPMESEGKPLEPDEKLIYKRKSRRYLLLFVTAYLLLTWQTIDDCAVSVALGISITAAFQMVGLLKNCKKE